jgi:hypothetical protein
LLKDRQPLSKDRPEQEHNESDTGCHSRKSIESESALRPIATRKAVTHLLLRLGR